MDENRSENDLCAIYASANFNPRARADKTDKTRIKPRLISVWQRCALRARARAN